MATKPKKRAPLPLGEEEKAQVRRELDAVCQSPAFNQSRRSKGFLTFVVEHALVEPEEQLKERTIGIEVFERSASYSTGDDPIVRVQAGDVRRRLDRFYRSPASGSAGVQISLPTGSYKPEFLFEEPAVDPEEKDDVARAGNIALKSNGDRSPESEPPVPWSRTPSLSAKAAAHSPALPPGWFGISQIHWMLALGVLLILAGVGAGLEVSRGSRSAVALFWRPTFKSDVPVLIGLPKSLTYAPGPRLYEEYDRQHPGTFQEEWQRTSSALPLDPDYGMKWSDMQLREGFGVGVGTAYAGADLTAFFATQKKASNLRIGSDYSFEDIRKAPTVLLGAFNNRWTMQLSTGLPYRFIQRDQRQSIEEQSGARRVWQGQRRKSGTADDYAVVYRLPNSETGQFLIIAAGIGSSGSQAAVDFICNDRYLQSAVGNLDNNWPNRNVGFVLKTSVTDHIAGPPVIVASAVW